MGAQGIDFVRGVAEDEDVVGANAVAHFDIGAIERADRQRAIQGEFHVAGAGRFGAGGGDLLRQVGCRDDDFRQADAVVRNEHDFELVFQARIVVDRDGDVIDQLDDLLGHVIGRRCLAGKHHRARHPVGIRIGEDAVVTGDHMQHIEQLALVFMDALDLDIEQGRRIERQAEIGRDPVGQAHLVGQFSGAKLRAENGIAGNVFQTG